MADEFKIEPVPLKPWTDGEIEMTLHGLIRYRTMTRAELEKEFPKAPDKTLEKGK
jgi:hypothetical protein